MKTTLFIFATLILSSFFAACNDKQTPCARNLDNYYTISDEAKSKVPYLRPEFDTISFVSNKGDTLVFERQPTDSGWYRKDGSGSMDCGPSYYNFYEIYAAKYKCIKGNASFEFTHGKELYITVKSNTRPDNDYHDMIEFNFNNLHLIFCDCVVDDKSYKKYIGDTIINSKNYKSVFYEFHEFDNSLIGKGYYNKDYGLFYIEDKTTSTNWQIIKP